jgi:hypothetical protein
LKSQGWCRGSCKAYKTEQDGMANCHVGYLPRRLFIKQGAKKFESLFLCVIEDLCTSTKSANQGRSHCNHGMSTCEIILNNYRYNRKNHKMEILVSVIPLNPIAIPMFNPTFRQMTRKMVSLINSQMVTPRVTPVHSPLFFLKKNKRGKNTRKMFTYKHK